MCRDYYLSPYELFSVVRNKLQLLNEQHIPIDYISFVPNGEPTLDCSLSKEIRLLRDFGYKIAVFTNSSLLWNDNVKEDLLFADYVSVKIDTVNEATWNTINRPHSRLRFHSILNGIMDFSKSYHGVLTTETMLVKNINDNLEELEGLSGYLSDLKRRKSYFAIPVRPPAEVYATAPDIHTLSEISCFVKNKIVDSEMLCLSEGNDFKGAGNIIEEELLGIMSVHPMTEESVEKFVKNKGGDPGTLKYMIDNKLITEINFDGKIFYRKTHLIA
jgi:wyosine [tRNA(Phe)-imidazoG37] synthetase (radical SAM superfamily)